MKELLHCARCGAYSKPAMPGQRTCAYCGSTNVTVYRPVEDFITPGEGPGVAILGHPERSQPMRRTAK